MVQGMGVRSGVVRWAVGWHIPTGVTLPARIQVTTIDGVVELRGRCLWKLVGMDTVVGPPHVIR